MAEAKGTRVRARQFGTIRKLPSGRFQARYTDLAGERRTAPVTFTTKKAASAWLSGTKSAIQSGRWKSPEQIAVEVAAAAAERAGVLTVSRLAEVWLETIPSENHRVISVSRVHRFINSELGDIPIDQLTRAGITVCLLSAYSRRCSPRPTPDTVCRRSKNGEGCECCSSWNSTTSRRSGQYPSTGSVEPRGRISAQPVEPRLATSSHAEDLVAQVEDVVLIGVAATGHRAIVSPMPTGCPHPAGNLTASAPPELPRYGGPSPCWRGPPVSKVRVRGTRLLVQSHGQQGRFRAAFGRALADE